MAKKPHSGNNDLALSYRIESLPRRVKRTTVLTRMIQFITTGRALPEDWSIILRWQNKEDGPWREDEFQNAVSESREGFNGLVQGRLERDRAVVRQSTRSRRRVA
jgi:hypothetical protein